MPILAKLRERLAGRVWLLAYIAEERRVAHGDMQRYWRSASYSVVLAVLASLGKWGRS